MRDIFHRFAEQISAAAGRPAAFALAVAVIVAWGASGPLFGFSDTWQLVINTGTTIVTFLMVFLIQNTQNRDADAMQLKLDELLRAVRKARRRFIDVEDLSDEELERMHAQFQELREKRRAGGSGRGGKKGGGKSAK
ncbi:MAG: low affinity iron permease family protein [Pseudomonadota bacterium]